MESPTKIAPETGGNSTNIENTNSPQAANETAAKKLAPRSSNQFRVGPPFGTTVVARHIYNDALGEKMTPQITARLDRGFNLIDGLWIGYKRNYFTLVAAFCFEDQPLSVCSTSTFLCLDTNQRQKLLYFKLRLVSTCAEDKKTQISLVQHTAKRDKGPQFSPPVYNAVPGRLPGHHVMKLVANIRNGDKISRCNRLFHLPHSERQQLVATTKCILSTYPDDKEVSLVARYERIQFLSSASGTRKQSSTNNKHYILEVQLLGVTEQGDVVLAYTQTPPLIVRGRSPSNYTSGEKKKRSSLEKIDDNFITDQENLDVPTRKKARIRSRKALQPLGNTRQKSPPLFLDSDSSHGNKQKSTEKVNSKKGQGENYSGEKHFSGITSAGSFGGGTNYFANANSVRRFDHHGNICSQGNTIGHESSNSYAQSPGQPEYVIPQDLSLVPQSVSDASFPEVTYTSLSDREPLNTYYNYRPRKITFSKLEEALRKYEAAKETLENLLQCSLGSNASWNLTIGATQDVNNWRSSSTPLQIRHLADNPASTPSKTKGHRPVLLCKHGLKKRTTAPRKVYSSSDLGSDNCDSSFRRFKEELEVLKSTILIRPAASLGNDLLSPLSTLNSEKEKEYVDWGDSSRPFSTI